MNVLELQWKQLAGLMSEAKIDYAVMGGLAVAIYGEPRLTLDVDVNIMLDTDNLEDFLKKAKKYAFSPLLKNIKKFTKTTGVIPMRFSKHKSEANYDFIIAQNTLEYFGIKRARFKKIYSTKIKVISPEDLIIHKITSGRPRDIEDVSGILIRQEGKLDLRYINFWLKKIAKSNKKPELIDLFKNLLHSY